MNRYELIMTKYLLKYRKGLTKSGNDRIDLILDNLGRSGLGIGMEICKGLIENYFLDEVKSKPIINLIDKMIEKQKKERKI